MRRFAWVLSVAMSLAACAPQRMALRESREFSAPEELECPDDRDVAVLCGAGLCTVVPEGPGTASSGTLTRGAAVFAPPMAGSPQRFWGSEQEFPWDRTPLITFEMHRDQPVAKLPANIRALVEEEAQKPHERHHIFPQEFKEWFKRKAGINVHDWVLTILLEDHRRIHRGPYGGPWNGEWRVWTRAHEADATRESIYRFAGEMIYRHELMGPLTRYYTPRADAGREDDK